MKFFRYYAGWADKIHGKTIPCGKKIILVISLCVLASKQLINSKIVLIRTWFDSLLALRVSNVTLKINVDLHRKVGVVV